MRSPIQASVTNPATPDDAEICSLASLVLGLVEREVGDSVVVIRVLEVTVTVLVLLTGIGSSGVNEAEATTVGAASSELIPALPKVRDEVSMVVD